MRKLVYDLIKKNEIIKTTEDFKDVIEWNKKEDCHSKSRMIEIEPTITKEAKEKRDRRIERFFADVG